MGYDNAQLARVYLHAWQVTGNGLFRTITEEILDYVVREMMYAGGRADDQQTLPGQHGPRNAADKAGGVAFYSTQDADSEGEEGKFFVWTPDEIRAVLEDEADAFMAAYGVTRSGNASTSSAHGFEGKNILEFVGDMEQRPALANARRRLFEAREKRVHPGRDEKVLTSWNGLMLAAFAEAERALNRDDYRLVAVRNADFLLRELRTKDGRLFHSWKAYPGQGEGAGRAKQNGFLEDYANLVEGLVELYQTTFEPRWYQAARELAETMIARFAAAGGGFYDTSDDHEPLITRPRDVQDNATPSGNGMAATVLLKLAGLAVEPRYAELAEGSLAGVQSFLGQYPLGFGQWLVALDYALSRPREIAIAGQPGAADTQALVKAATDGFRPHQVVAMGEPGQEVAAVPLLANRPAVNGQAAAYVCQDYSCQAPVTEPEELKALV